MGPISDAVNVNIILRGQLEQLLRTWRSDAWDDELQDFGPVSYEKIAVRINELIAAEAALYGAEPSTYAWSSVHRWVNVIYEIPDVHGRPPQKPQRRPKSQ